jgi:16S rRNA G966 N2-methylase RsmD
VSDNYPVLVASASLPSIREQAEQLRCYLADDANEFDKAWLEEQQRRLDAVHSYIKNKKIRAEISHCQRWVELRIGEWLGPRRPGERTDLTSLPGKEVEINDRHKHEFRFLAENKATVTAILGNHPGVKITRAALLRHAARQEALARSSKHPKADPALYLGDFRRIERIKPESFDWVITDPPYAKEYLPLLTDLSRCAERWLKPGGSLLVMSGQSYLEEVVHALSSHLTYRWQLTYLTPGGQPPKCGTAQ